MAKPGPTSKSKRYQIRLKGVLDEQWLSWFNDSAIIVDRELEGGQVTTLSVLVPDQAKLRGILNKIWDLNLTVLSVSCIEDA